MAFYDQLEPGEADIEKLNKELCSSELAKGNSFASHNVIEKISHVLRLAREDSCEKIACNKNFSDGEVVSGESFYSFNSQMMNSQGRSNRTAAELNDATSETNVLKAELALSYDEKQALEAMVAEAHEELSRLHAKLDENDGRKMLKRLGEVTSKLKLKYQTAIEKITSELVRTKKMVGNDAVTMKNLLEQQKLLVEESEKMQSFIEEQDMRLKEMEKIVAEKTKQLVQLNQDYTEERKNSELMQMAGKKLKHELGASIELNKVVEQKLDQAQQLNTQRMDEIFKSKEAKREACFARDEALNDLRVAKNYIERLERRTLEASESTQQLQNKATDNGLENLQNQVKYYETTLAELTGQKEKLACDLKDVSRNFTDLKQRFEAEMSESFERVKERDEKILRLEGDLTASNIELRGNERKLEKAEGQLKDLKENYESTSNKYKCEIEQLTAQIESMTKTRLALLDKLDKTDRNLHEAVYSKELLSGQKSVEIENLSDQLKRTVEKFEARISNNSMMYEEMVLKAKKHSAEQEELHKKWKSEAQYVTNKWEKQVTTLHEKYKAEKTLRISVEAENKQLRKSIAKQSRVVKAAKQMFNDMHSLSKEKSHVPLECSKVVLDSLTSHSDLSDSDCYT